VLHHFHLINLLQKDVVSQPMEYIHDQFMTPNTIVLVWYKQYMHVNDSLTHYPELHNTFLSPDCG
jgi:hypothetical protein